jgi:hypothetical protein
MTCDGCDRAPHDWIEVNGVRWIPELEKTAGGRVLCWACRETQHSDMPPGYVPESFWEQVRDHKQSHQHA